MIKPLVDNILLKKAEQHFKKNVFTQLSFLYDIVTTPIIHIISKINIRN